MTDRIRRVADVSVAMPWAAHTDDQMAESRRTMVTKSEDERGLTAVCCYSFPLHGRGHSDPAAFSRSLARLLWLALCARKRAALLFVRGDVPGETPMTEPWSSLPLHRHALV